MAILHVLLTAVREHLWLLCGLLLGGHLFLTSSRDSLKRIPGPFLARFTDFWRFWCVWRGRSSAELRRLHRKHGAVVRIGPDCVDISDPAAVELIYGIQNKFAKSAFYEAWKQLSNGKPLEALFNTQDEALHARMKKPVAKAYAMSTVVEFEPFVDSSMRRLIEQLDSRFARLEATCDIGLWLHYFALDVVSEMTFGSPLGFVEQGRDIDNMIRSQRQLAHSQAVIGQMPWTDYIYRKNPILLAFRTQSSTYFTRFAQLKIKERVLSGEASPAGTDDFLDRFLDAKEAHSDTMTDQMVVAFTMSNVFAGADTTASTLRAIVYYVLKHAGSRKRLMRELRGALDAGNLSKPVVTWAEAQRLPYLDAVIKESMRLFPGVGLPLERIVPPGPGLVVGGRVIPPGTIVGMSAPVVHRDEATFGPQPDDFIPERWLQLDGEEEESFQQRVGRMKKADLTFGHGARTCIGKNISLLEVYKAVPSLLLALKIDLVDPSAEWQTFNTWFSYETDINVTIKRHA